jgi:L-amino acid N-acyltransferase YncA
MIIRPAADGDAESIARIWNEGIEDRGATFDIEVRSAQSVLERLRGRPALVAERDGAVIGFAAAWAYSARACYAGISELSIYISRDARGAGAGGALLRALIADCERRGNWKVIGKLFAENAASRALLARAGFREVGVHHRHGKLDGEWRDVVLVEKLIGEANELKSG